MSSAFELDLSGSAWPVNLLEFKRALLGLQSRDILKVLVQDPDVAEHIMILVEHSENIRFQKRKEGTRVLFTIQKNG